MILKDFPFGQVIREGYNGVRIMGCSIRINNDSKQLNHSEYFSELFKELNNHPHAKEIAYSNVVSTRTFFDELVIVIDYKEET